ncbi:MAG TPA: DUF4337 family protein [Candidatus Rubrimentiphilum sp.]|nr:DUF4337 family protein [Candidatus Rubrimentiphilum sp.]
MPEFNWERTLDEVKERDDQIEHGRILIPITASVIAVFAALATLFANHSSISGLAEKNAAILDQTKSADQYAYYESSRIKVHVYEALLGSGIVTARGASKQMQTTAATEQQKANRILKGAQTFAVQAEDHLRDSETFMTAYERYEVAATLFEVSIVLVSITALMRARVLYAVGLGATLVGLGFFISGFIR